MGRDRLRREPVDGVGRVDHAAEHEAAEDALHAEPALLEDRRAHGFSSRTWASGGGAAPASRRHHDRSAAITSPVAPAGTAARGPTRPPAGRVACRPAPSGARDVTAPGRVSAGWKTAGPPNQASTVHPSAVRHTAADVAGGDVREVAAPVRRIADLSTPVEHEELLGDRVATGDGPREAGREPSVQDERPRPRVEPGQARAGRWPPASAGPASRCAAA